MKNIKNQKGAISLFVMLAMLFFLAFILGIYTLTTRRSAAQLEAVKETQAIYKKGANANSTYDSMLIGTDSVIPITTTEQIKTVKAVSTSSSTTKYLIDGNVYTYKKGASYRLENDIIFDFETEITGNAVQIYDYMLYNNDIKIDRNGHDIYYQLNDGSMWKCVVYQYATTSNLFSMTSGANNYFGSAFLENTYSILDDLDSYKNAEKFEFLLAYNCYSGNFNPDLYNRWRQTEKPQNATIENKTGAITGVTEARDVVKGYEDNFTGGTTRGLGTDKYWGGLALDTSSSRICYVDGSIGRSDWWYAIATLGLYNNAIPVSGVTSVTTSTGTNVAKSTTANKCLLFVRVK